MNTKFDASFSQGTGSTVSLNWAGNNIELFSNVVLFFLKNGGHYDCNRGPSSPAGLLAFDVWLPGGHEIWRDCWCYVTAQARITKFCTLIELIKRNIFYHYVIALSLVLWLPEVKKLIFGQKRDFQWRRLWRRKTTAATILKFGVMIHLNEYYFSLHYTESLSLIVWVPESKN